MKKTKAERTEHNKKHSDYMKKYRNTPTGFAHTRFLAIQRRCVNGKFASQDPECPDGRYLEKGVRCLMTKQEFWDWCLAPAQVKKLNNIVKNGDIPALALIDTSLNYSIDNIRITTWAATNKLGQRHSLEKRMKKYWLDGYEMTVQEHMNRLGLKGGRRYIITRLRKGWDVESAIKTPKKTK